MNWLDRKIDDFIRRIRDSDRKPIEIAGSYWRWFVWPRNRFLNCYLHHWYGDDPQDLHDHRAMNVSIMLSRYGFREELFLWKPVEGQPLPATYFKHIEYLRPRIRLPSTAHRVQLWRIDGKPVGVWSLFFKFPDCRRWGFWTEGAKWVKFEDYVSDPDPLSPGYGVRK